MTVPAVLPPARWRAEVERRLHEGARFGALYGDDGGRVRCVFVGEDGTPAMITTTGGGTMPSIVDLMPAARWAEREAHDRYGIAFEGHDPLRPLVDHTAEWRVPVTGSGVHEVAVGPIHAGIIESGHFRFHTVGERILLLDLRLFYKHRGLERAAEGLRLEDGLPVVQRACAACAVANSVAYALAAEQILDYRAGADVARTRTILLELERFWNHLNDLSAMCAGVGFSAGAMAFAGLKEEAQRLNHRVTGHRFLFGAVAVGGSSLAISDTLAADARATVAAIVDTLKMVWHTLLFDASVQDRFTGAGVVGRETALRIGAVGPTARASGIASDVRTSSTELAYSDLEPAAQGTTAGDVAARAGVRYAELRASAAMLSRLLDRGVAPATLRRGPAAQTPDQRDDAGVGRVESARGETLCIVESSAGGIARLHLRTASYANWPVLAEAVVGSLLGEFPLINKSFELCYACVDR